MEHYVTNSSYRVVSCSGNYGPDVTLAKLKDFHRRRLQVLVEAGPDLLAFETIPNKLEAQVWLNIQRIYVLHYFISSVSIVY